MVKLHEEVEAAAVIVRELISKVNPVEDGLARIAIAFTAEEQHLVDAAVSLNEACEILKREDR